MKHTLFILALITASIQTFAQSPRIKLNQITKDSVTGSVLISSPTDSGMVYSRDLFISYGADTVLILGGDTLAATSSIISSVLSDGVTITGDGTTGSELTVDTSVLATLRALSDSLALVISSVTADGVTITGDGTVGSPLKVDTATVVATKGDLTGYVDLTTTQIVGGAKTFSSTVTGTRFDPTSSSTTGNGMFLPTTNTLGFSTNGSERMTIDASGNLGLGITPSAWSGFTTLELQGGFIGGGGTTYFEVGQNNYFDGSFRYKVTGAATVYEQNAGRHIWYKAPSGTAGNVISFTQAMTLDASGRLGIGTTPSEKLDVNGKVKISDLTGTGGNAVYENGGVLGVASDARFKSHIADLDNGIEKVLNLKPKYFIDNRNSTFQQLGFYAQEVKSVINEASYPIGNTDYLGINDRAIIAVAVKAIQEQQSIIESQATEIEQLKTLITELSNRLTILENN